MIPYTLLVLSFFIFGKSVYCMEQKAGESAIKPYTLEDVKACVPHTALYQGERNNKALLIRKACDRANNLSTIVADQAAFKRLAVSSQEVKDFFLRRLQNQSCIVDLLGICGISYYKGEYDLAKIRTYIAICAMIDAKDDPQERFAVFGYSGFADFFSTQENDQQLREILTAYNKRNNIVANADKGDQ